MSLNKETNGYIMLFVTAMVVVVAVLLTVIAEVLKPKIEFNRALDQQKKILKSVLALDESEEATKLEDVDFVASTFEGNITGYLLDASGNTETFMIGEKGDTLDPFTINFKRETRKDSLDRILPVYVYDNGSDKYYILPMIGLGLWDEISGYLALESDFNTIRGAAFDHKGETPGLGAEIVEFWFREQFVGKSLFDEKSNYKFEVKKAAINLTEHQVDAVSGATITCDGVTDMFENCTAFYKPYFETLKTL